MHRRTDKGIHKMEAAQGLVHVTNLNLHMACTKKYLTVKKI